MNFLEKLYNHASDKGYQGTQSDIDEKASDLTSDDITSIEVMSELFTFVVNGGYTLDIVHFEDKYWTFWGKRPKGR